MKKKQTDREKRTAQRQVVFKLSFCFSAICLMRLLIMFFNIKDDAFLFASCMCVCVCYYSISRATLNPLLKRINNRTFFACLILKVGISLSFLPFIMMPFLLLTLPAVGLLFGLFPQYPDILCPLIPTQYSFADDINLTFHFFLYFHCIGIVFVIAGIAGDRFSARC